MSSTEKKQVFTPVTIEGKNLQEAKQIIENIIHHPNGVSALKLALAKMLMGWITTPLELEPNERLDMAIYYQDIQEHFLQLEALEVKVMNDFEENLAKKTKS